MKKIRSLCLLGLANLECPAEALDFIDNDKKWRSQGMVRAEELCLSHKDDVDWFYEYQKAHQSMDEDSEKL